jgi:hypothetical protein
MTVTVRPFSSVVEDVARARLRPPLELEDELALTRELLEALDRDRLNADAEAEDRPRRLWERAKRPPTLCSHRTFGCSSTIDEGATKFASTDIEALTNMALILRKGVRPPKRPHSIKQLDAVRTSFYRRAFPWAVNVMYR